MRHWISIAAAALPALLVGASALPADTVRGYVINPITGTRVEHAEIAFFAKESGQVNEILRKPTDAQGRFAFSGPFLTPDLSFVLVALYQGVPYPSSELQIGAQKEIILEVYEPSTVDDEIHIAIHTLFLNLHPEKLEVAQFVQIDNQGEKTYAGQGQGSERQVMEFALPSGVFNLTGSFNQASETRFFDNRPLPPGISQITFTFELDLQQLGKGYSHQVLYPTEQLEVLLQPSTIQPGPPFVDLGIEELHGDRYRRLRLVDLQRGQSFLVSLPLPRPLRWALKWMALGAAILSGILTLVSGRIPSPATAPRRLDPEALQRQREQLLRQLARLDDAHSGQPDDDRYQAERAHLIDRALTLYRLLEERDGNPAA